MSTQEYPRIGEKLVTETLANGLQLLIVPKADFHQTYALMTINYGAIDVKYVPMGGQETVTDPEGIAHFLEHKLFEKEDHDAFDLFGQTGASANAFTSSTQTSFLFSATDRVEDNLKILLDFVQSPYFSAKTVAKEKGIIGQEIQMYQDDPGWRLYFGIIGNLYPNTAIAADVTGSLTSIDEITSAMLYRAYNTFYQPSNMTLTVVGNVTPDQVIETVSANQDTKTFAAATPLQRFDQFDGDVATVLPYRALHLPLVRAKSIVGVKGTRDLAQDASGMKTRIALRLVLELIFGDSSPLYQSWYDDGIVDDSFDCDLTVQRGFNYMTLGGDADDPTALSEKVAGVLAHGADQPTLNEARFARIKKATLGKYFTTFNSVASIASQLSSESFSSANLFDYAQSLNELTLADLKRAADEYFNMDAVSVFHLLPAEDV